MSLILFSRLVKYKSRVYRLRHANVFTWLLAWRGGNLPSNTEGGDVLANMMVMAMAVVMVMIIVMVVTIVVMMMMTEKSLPGDGLELAAPVSQMRRAVLPFPETSMIKRNDGH